LSTLKMWSAHWPRQWRQARLPADTFVSFASGLNLELVLILTVLIFLLGFSFGFGFAVLPILI
jgi:hypothetical protein